MSLKICREADLGKAVVYGDHDNGYDEGRCT